MWVFLNYIFKYSVPWCRFSTLGAPFMGLTIFLGFLYPSTFPWSFVTFYFHFILVTFLPLFLCLSLSCLQGLVSLGLLFMLSSFLGCFWFCSCFFPMFCRLTFPHLRPEFVLGAYFCWHFLRSAPIKLCSQLSALLHASPQVTSATLHPFLLRLWTAVIVAFGRPYVYFESTDYICLLVLLKMGLFSSSLLLLYAIQE